jgi:CDP-diacylglycerol--glycerol-3-phosphate 3-phosphatidyltransferase
MVIAPLPGWTDWITLVLVLAAVVVTVVTGAQYLLDSRNRPEAGGQA